MKISHFTNKADVLNQFRKAIFYDEVVESKSVSENLCKHFWELVLSMQMPHN